MGDRDKALALIKQGISVPKIAEETGYSKASIYSLKKYGTATVKHRPPAKLPKHEKIIFKDNSPSKEEKATAKRLLKIASELMSIAGDLT